MPAKFNSVLMQNARGAAPFDRGRKAGLSGKPRRPNPYDHPERQTGSTMAWERRCSEWDEGWSAGNAFVEFRERHERKRIQPQAAFVAGARYAESLHSDLADEYDRLIRHMNAGGNFDEFQVEESQRRNSKKTEPSKTPQI